MRSSTVKLLNSYLSTGGTVLSMGKPGPYVDGEAIDNVFDELSNNPNWSTLNDFTEIKNNLNKFLVPYVQSNTAFPTGLAHMRRELGDGKVVYFFVNHSMEEFVSDIKITGVHVEKWNLWNGEQEEVRYTLLNGNIQIPINLKRNESLMLLVEQSEASSNSVNAVEESIAKKQISSLPFNNFIVRPEELNVLNIDYCDLEFNGEKYTDVNVIEAGIMLYKRRGFKNNPWDNSIQFRRRIVDRNKFGANSGFSVSYHFEVLEDLGGSPIQLIVERAESYSLMINGHPVRWIEGEHWLDHHNGVADIKDFVQKGRNTITITAEHFDVLLEVESVYLRGNFTVNKVDGKWVLGALKALSLGVWTNQGYPFYSGAFTYNYKLDIPQSADSVIAKLPEFETTACSLYINGKRVGLVGLDGGRRVELTNYLHPGLNEVSLRVCGSLKNLLGPHHAPSKPRRTAWPGFWKTAPKFGQPAAEDYDLIQYGLQEHVKFEVIKNI